VSVERDDPPAILTYGDPQLRRRCAPADPGDPALTGLIARLWRALHGHAVGVALSAPQIGEPVRVFVIADPRRGQPRRRVFVNPEIEARSRRTGTFEEGCLSFPDLYLKLRRPQWIRLRYLDGHGRPRVLEDGGLLARIVQHELDHLDGTLFIDHLSGVRRWLLRGRLERIQREGAA
jgi:peptide deformylase